MWLLVAMLILHGHPAKMATIPEPSKYACLVDKAQVEAVKVPDGQIVVECTRGKDA